MPALLPDDVYWSSIYLFQDSWRHSITTMTKTCSSAMVSTLTNTSRIDKHTPAFMLFIELLRLTQDMDVSKRRRSQPAHWHDFRCPHVLHFFWKLTQQGNDVYLISVCLFQVCVSIRFSWQSHILHTQTQLWCHKCTLVLSHIHINSHAHE